ncbi:MAG: hypothetical protein OEY14_16245 [Myxococcales bacterium]|nr:hypothetical protein [Myxococcales bacterium]
MLGLHPVQEGQRLDHLASHYLRDPHAYWRIAEINGVMIPDALAEIPFLRIPSEG